MRALLGFGMLVSTIGSFCIGFYIAKSHSNAVDYSGRIYPMQLFVQETLKVADSEDPDEVRRILRVTLQRLQKARTVQEFERVMIDTPQGR